MSLNRVASPGCAFLVDNFDGVIKLIDRRIFPKSY